MLCTLPEGRPEEPSGHREYIVQRGPAELKKHSVKFLASITQVGARVGSGRGLRLHPNFDIFDSPPNGFYPTAFRRLTLTGNLTETK